jgi:hypothetical protein
MQNRFAPFLGAPAARRLIFAIADAFSLIWRCSSWFFRFFRQPSIIRAGETPNAAYFLFFALSRGAADQG